MVMPTILFTECLFVWHVHSVKPPLPVVWPVPYFILPRAFLYTAKLVLPSVREKTLGKDSFAVRSIAV